MSEGEKRIVTSVTTAKLLFVEIFAVIIFIVGIILLCMHTDTVGWEHVEDYTDCIDGNQAAVKCKDTLAFRKEPCQCYITITFEVPMDAVVTAYYELDTFDQSHRGYYDSRDDKQLSGVLSAKPSDSCGSYSYINTTEGIKPIAPCGEVADSMFNDTFSLLRNNEYVPYIDTGLISEEDKAPYRNPVGNLEEAFKNFSKPMNWDMNVWQLDNLNASNNGFQNEAFIVWMKTELRRKPVWRVSQTDVYEHGIPAGNYTLRVNYAYPPSRYNGRRKFIISSIHQVVNSVRLGIGIVLLLLAITIFVGKIFYNRKVYGKYIACENTPNRQNF